MTPASSVSGWYLSHPEAQYFGIGRVGRDQVEDYARRKGWNVEEAERWLSPNLGYERGTEAADLREEGASPPPGETWRPHRGDSMTLRDLIDDGRVHLLDGAMGTVLYAQGVFVNVCYDELNLTDPVRVRRVHEAYLHAGAELLETNTFGANPVKLSAHGLDARTEEINAAAARLAREAAGERAGVLGAVGPLGLRIEPWGPTSRTEATGLFGRQVAGLLEGGVDGFILETFADLEELKVALAAVRGATDLPVFAQVTVGEEGNTPFGTSVEEAARALDAAGADVIGLNCSVGPAVVLDGIERMAAVTDRPLSALPNAGVPRSRGGPEDLPGQPGVSGPLRPAPGGGRGPIHRRMLRHHPGPHPGHAGGGGRLQPAPRTQVAVSARAAPAPLRRPGDPPGGALRLGSEAGGHGLPDLRRGGPPPGVADRRMVAAARALQEAGVDAVTVADSPRALSRMGALPASTHPPAGGGGEILTHYTCRGRRMPGMISDLLGAAAAGIRNLVLITGDPPTEGPYADAEAIFDIDAIGLTNVVRRFNRGLDPGGNPHGSPHLASSSAWPPTPTPTTWSGSWTASTGRWRPEPTSS
jgi:methionine synthase / methylenetetrahydrofolate reductase(NADPH)